MASKDADGAPLPTSTARPGTRSPSACCSPRETQRADGGVWQATLDFPSTVETLRRARPRRLRGHPERLGRQPLDRRGHRRRRRHRRARTRKPAEQLRLPLRADGRGRPDVAASSRRCRSCRTGPASRSSSTRARPTATSRRRTSATCTPTADLRDQLGDDPRHRRRRHRAVRRQRAGQGRRRHAVQAAGERPVPAGPTSRSSSSTRPATPTPARRPARRAAASAPSSSSSQSADRRHRHAQLLYQRRPGALGFDNCAFLTEEQVVVVEDAGDTLHAQRNALDSGYVLDLNADYSDRRNQPVRFARRGPRRRRPRIDARSPAPTPASRTTATTRSPASTSPTATRATRRHPRRAGSVARAGWRRPGQRRGGVFYTAQHGDNVTWETIPGPLIAGGHLGAPPRVAPRGKPGAQTLAARPCGERRVLRRTAGRTAPYTR